MTASAKTLDQIKNGQQAVITAVEGAGPIRRRLLDMGLTRGAKIQKIKASPLGDPVEYKLRGYHLSLRQSEARLIRVKD